MEKQTFFGTFFSNVPTAINLERGGGLDLNGPALKKITFFCGFPYLTMYNKVSSLRNCADLFFFFIISKFKVYPVFLLFPPPPRLSETNILWKG